jgi:acetyl-CoA synthetase
MSDNQQKMYPVSFKRAPLIDEDTYHAWYKRSVEDPQSFWAEKAIEHLHWYTQWKKVQSGTLAEGNVKWFEGGTLNASYNCIDRHIEQGKGGQTAIIWEGNEGETLTISYAELLVHVSRLANVLKSRGVKRGDRVCIYMPMIPEATYAMLACARIGAIHSVVFAGFSPEALSSRINDAQCTVVVTADVGRRGDKVIALKSRVDEAILKCPSVHTVLVVQTQEEQVSFASCDIDYHEAISQVSDVCEPEHMDAEDPLFILYTSGSTGKPKGVLHTTGGYLLYASMTHKYVFDYQEGDIYWCAADVGWITGHTYIVYGPLLNCATVVMFEGTPTYPSPSRYFEVIDKHKVNIFYSTPTAIRALMAYGNAFVESTSRASLVRLGSVGEPINPEAWRWYYEIVGNGECPIVDTWWQTETGGIAITPLPGASTLKPGSAMRPFFGIEPVIVDSEGRELIGEASGALLLKGSHPGLMRDVYGDHERFLDTYLRPYPGYYLTGDGVERDADGDLTITGRIDDTLNISGRLIGTAELESSLVLHVDIVEAAVVSIPHPIKGQSIFAFVTPVAGVEETLALYGELCQLVNREIGSFAKPDTILVTKFLPKTRSGKIMRRVLRKIASGEHDDLGDTSTLADAEVVTEIIEAFKKKSGL